MVRMERQGAVDVVRLDEQLTGEAADTLRDVVPRYLAKGRPMAVLDFTATRLLDSAALEYLLDLQQSCCERGGEVRLAAVSELCYDVLRATGVQNHFEIFPEVKLAVRSFLE